MKKLHFFASVLSISMLIATSAMAGPGWGSGQGKGYGNGKGSGNGNSGIAVDSVEKDDLRFMREEEKLARDVYLTMDKYWGKETKVFANIAKSEEQHTTTVKYLLDKFDVEDPVVNDIVGVFTHKELQALYDELVEKGANSLIEALRVGALIEEKDMTDILAAIDRTDERPIILAYSNLLDGSKDHLRAFVRVIKTQGLHYEAQLLSQEEVDLILSAPE